MIPRRLTLKNFLSYRDATLDFSGLHVACICGANGAGKSSLLEAIAWAIWGESRAATDDDVIHLGEIEARVDFVFDYHQRTYRVIRTRYRGQSSVLEFQLETATGWRSLTEKGMRATQQLILQHLKLDYETFINSAYLRQGRADEFMLKRPSDRKQILADLLKLDQYDVLEEKAKERSRQCKAELGLIERSLEQIDRQLDQSADLDAEQQQVTTTIEQLQQQQSQDAEQWRQLQELQQQRQTWQQQLTLQQQQYQQGLGDHERLQQELAAAQQQQQQVQQILQQAEAIATGFTQLQALQAADDQQTAQLHAHQAALSQRQALQQQQTDALSTVKDTLRHVQAQVAALDQQEDELRQTLGKSEEIQGAIAQLHQARARLVTYDHRQLEASPLMQRRQQIQTQIDRLQARLSARLEELQSLIHDLQQQQQRQPALQQSIEQVAEQVSYLEQRRLYQQKVREKGSERRNFLERLQERQRELEQQLSEIDHKIQLLQREEHSLAEPSREESSQKEDRERTLQLEGLTYSIQQTQTLASTSEPSTPDLPLFQLQPAFPPCPLCDRPLDQHHWSLVIEHHQRDRQDILDQLWVIREQLTTSDREIKVLRQEYRRLEKELAYYGPALERRGQLQEQLQGTVSSQQRLQQLCHEQAEIQRSLDGLTFAPDLQDELHQIDQHLAGLNYDDRTHALARGEVDRWRWAEIKQAELRQAERRLAQIAERKPHLQQEWANLEQQLAASQQSPLQQQINALDRQITQIDYSADSHTAVRHALKAAQGWQGQYQALEHAQQRDPQLQQQVNTLKYHVETRSHALQALRHDIDILRAQLGQCADASPAIQALDAQMQQRRSQLDAHLAQLGRLQQQQQQLALLSQQRHEQAQQIPLLQRHYRVYQELAQAFSKNGIQALMIENLLPQLETEANQILGRLSNHQLHIQFVTQRSSRRRDSVNRATKLIDTLDILIGNLQGTRPYETYSGGEAFRVNFAIRLALARLLAQRSGTALQLLVIDEGFGTQDEAGCDRLIAAINAIAADFACILTVTHMPHLKEAFQTRVEISKTDHGSQINLLV